MPPLNFGLFATPERNLIFDINDFDETLPAPWEWDVKRLAVSFVVAAGDNHLTRMRKPGCGRDRVCALVPEHLREYSKMSPLEIWYDRLDAKACIEIAPTPR